MMSGSRAYDGTGRALDAVEAGRRRIAHEREIAVAALGNLYERLGEEDLDVAAVDQVLSNWRLMLLVAADSFSEGMRILS